MNDDGSRSIDAERYGPFHNSVCAPEYVERCVTVESHGFTRSHNVLMRSGCVRSWMSPGRTPFRSDEKVWTAVEIEFRSFASFTGSAASALRMTVGTTNAASTASKPTVTTVSIRVKPRRARRSVGKPVVLIVSYLLIGAAR